MLAAVRDEADRAGRGPAGAWSAGAPHAGRPSPAGPAAPLGRPGRRPAGRRRRGRRGPAGGAGPRPGSPLSAAWSSYHDQGKDGSALRARPRPSGCSRSSGRPPAPDLAAFGLAKDGWEARDLAGHVAAVAEYRDAEGGRVTLMRWRGDLPQMAKGTEGGSWPPTPGAGTPATGGGPTASSGVWSAPSTRTACTGSPSTWAGNRRQPGRARLLTQPRPRPTELRRSACDDGVVWSSGCWSGCSPWPRPVAVATTTAGARARPPRPRRPPAPRDRRAGGGGENGSSSPRPAPHGTPPAST